MTTVYKFKAYYTDAGVGAVQDPAPTCTVINMADDSKLADAQATTASTNMPGLYSYEYSGNDGLDCVAWFKTTDTGCDVKELASYVSEKITTNLNADVAGVETKVDTIDTNVDSILADTGTDGVLVSSGTGAKQISLDAGKVLLQATQTGVTIPTVTTLTNLPAATTDWLTAAAVKADAVTKIQANLALEATLTAIKGTGWTNETLEKIYADVSDTLNNSSATEENIEAFMGVGWTTETLKAIKTVIDAIKAKTDNLPSDPADDSDLDTSIAAVKSVVDAVKVKTDNLPASPAAVGSAMTLTAAYDKAKDDVLTPLATVDGIVDAIKAKTDNLPSDPADQSLLEAAIAAVSGGGTGDMSWTYTLTETDLTPIADATVWVTSDEAGASILAQGTTNASGQVTFLLNDGATVYVWRKKFGWEGTNPDVEVVS